MALVSAVPRDGWCLLLCGSRCPGWADDARGVRLADSHKEHERSENTPQRQVRCPQGHTDGIRPRGVEYQGHHTFEQGRGGPAATDLRRRVVTYRCEECQEAFKVEKR